MWLALKLQCFDAANMLAKTSWPGLAYLRTDTKLYAALHNEYSVQYITVHTEQYLVVI
jgi:hypothetical protein